MDMNFRRATCLMVIPLILLGSVPLLGEPVLPSPLPPPCFPVRAPELLNWLPAAPANWRLESSIGQSMFGGSNKPVTIISRHYQYVPPPVQPGEKPPEVKLTNILMVLTDTAYVPDSLRLFAVADQLAGKPNIEFKRILGYPAILTRRSTGDNIVMLLLGGRMTLTVSGNSDQKDVIDWLGHLPLADLDRKAQAAPRAPFKGNSYSEMFVNQLNPKQNRETLIGLVMSLPDPAPTNIPAPAQTPAP